MMKRFTLLVFFMVLLGSSYAKDIRGVVMDEDKTPLEGAYIQLLQAGYHTHSDEFGKFIIPNAGTGDTLQIMYLGFETVSVPVGNNDDSYVIQMKEADFELETVIVGQNIKKNNIISKIDLELAPVTSSQEVLRKVPGLFIGQHAGGGKAEQIFLRGFDIDHGTDVSLTVDGIPVNMVSHAHGQGYSDLHFVIPETIEAIDFGKGPYYADKGNFTTAGYVGFNTKDKLKESEVTLDYGRFNYGRILGMFDIVNKENHNAYIASEFISSDGPFESSQNFRRINLMGKYTANIADNRKLSVMASHFTSRWDASGQIPVRAVEQGLITRFGAIDDTEGGQTSRTNVGITYDHMISDNTIVKNNIYYSLYDFELFSNFTFFLEDPVNGDQIRQYEDRQMFGGESVISHSVTKGDSEVLFRVGVGFRNDRSKGNELSRTLNRTTTLSTIQKGDIDETNYFLYGDIGWDIGSFLIEPGVRLDVFRFSYVDDLTPLYDNLSQSKAFVSPKLNIIYNLNHSTQLFLKGGIGFHSNDTRVVLDDTSDAPILPAAYGADLGITFKPVKRMIANAALWYLHLDQEFVYVGDAGIVELSGKTRRLGVDAGIRYQFTDWLFGTSDFTYSFARSTEDAEGENLIPLAPVITTTAGLSVVKDDFNVSLQFRYLGDRPANEDNSIVAEGYYITDLSANYNFKKLRFGFSIENLFNQEWNETQFATESRLFNEAQSVEEIHFTPGTPFNIRGTLSYRF